MFGLSGGEILLIGLIALLLFGNDKLPQNIKKFFHGWNQTKKVATDIQRSWHEIKLDIKNNIDLEEEKAFLASHIETNTSLPLPQKPKIATVSQEEIDSYKPELENHNKETNS